jgi:hypothetical protein
MCNSINLNNFKFYTYATIFFPILYMILYDISK